MNTLNFGAKLWLVSAVLAAPAALAGPFTLSDRQMDGVTAGGIVSDITATAFASGEPSIAITDVDSSVSRKAANEFGIAEGDAQSLGGARAETLIVSSSTVDTGERDSSIDTFTFGYAEGDAYSYSTTNTRVVSNNGVTVMIGRVRTRTSGTGYNDTFSLVDPAGDLVRSNSLSVNKGSGAMSRATGIGLTFHQRKR